MTVDFPLSRRMALAQLAAALAAGGARAEALVDGRALKFGRQARFSFELLTARTRRIAQAPYRPTPIRMSDALEALDFDAIGQIRYRSEDALFRDAPGDAAVEFFHLNRYVREPVRVSVVEGGQARELLYSKALFDIPPTSSAARLPGDLGFAGFRVMNRDGRGDWLAFQGAAYFRAAAPFNQYGLSARGLAIDTATAKPEEFPRFTAFWLARDPAGGLVIFALLEGPSVAGAYRIATVKGAKATVQNIEARLFFRKPVERLGLAPLTSMYWYGRGDRPRAADWRPQIHDSDGLAIWTGAGERIWRPLANPPRVITNSFADHNPRGFGLMQRDRAFDDYQDDGAFYDRRPSLWVEPLGPWGAGSVQLLEIPTASETDDNIAAYWSPAEIPATGDRLDLRYRLTWGDEEPDVVGVAKVIATRSGLAGRPGLATIDGARKFVIDFAGGRLAGLGRDSGVQPVVTLSRGAALAMSAYAVVGTPVWRLMFDAPVPAGGLLDLRAFLRLNGGALTETWVGQVFGRGGESV